MPWRCLHRLLWSCSCRELRRLRACGGRELRRREHRSCVRAGAASSATARARCDRAPPLLRTISVRIASRSKKSSGQIEFNSYELNSSAVQSTWEGQLGVRRVPIEDDANGGALRDRLQVEDDAGGGGDGDWIEIVQCLLTDRKSTYHKNGPCFRNR